MQKSQKKIAIIGAGHLGNSLIGGLIASGVSPKHIWATRHAGQAIDDLAVMGVHVAHDNHEAISHAEVIVFSVKPHDMAEVTTRVKDLIQARSCLVLSTAAGVPLTRLESWLGAQCSIVRCMPNTPALIRKGMTGLYANQKVSDVQRADAEAILRAVGEVVWVNSDEAVDAVTAISGSGPAYFFLVIEALQEAAEQLGLPEETAKMLAQQTAYGASCMALHQKEAVSVLRKQVTSPGGTTEQAIKCFEEAGLKAIFKKATAAAKARAASMTQEI